MENCLYMKQRICSIEVLNEFDIKLHTVIDEWRKAGDNNELKCEDCGQQVILRAGDVRIPHFAHKPGTKVICSYDERNSEYHRTAKKNIPFLSLKSNRVVKYCLRLMLNMKKLIQYSWKNVLKPRLSKK